MLGSSAQDVVVVVVVGGQGATMPIDERVVGEPAYVDLVGPAVKCLPDNCVLQAGAVQSIVALIGQFGTLTARAHDMFESLLTDSSAMLDRLAQLSTKVLWSRWRVWTPLLTVHRQVAALQSKLDSTSDTDLARLKLLTNSESSSLAHGSVLGADH